jgi:hypothetical protein
MSRCPYCDAEAPDPLAEIAHMEAEHPEVIDERLERAGFVRVGETWVDRLSDACAPVRTAS